VHHRERAGRRGKERDCWYGAVWCWVRESVIELGRWKTEHSTMDLRETYLNCFFFFEVMGVGPWGAAEPINYKSSRTQGW